MRSSEIGGQAVIEGVMMKNKDQYAIAVRKPDHQIEIKKGEYKSLKDRNKFCALPVVRGIVAFVESLKLGMETLTYSASFMEDEEQAEKKQVTEEQQKKNEAKETVIMGLTVMLSIVIAVAVFVLLPFFVSEALRKVIPSIQLRGLIEGVIRVGLFIGYVKLISLLQDIKRVFMYHGAEHKTINCVEHGLDLNVENVRGQSKCHKRCGTSFLLLVMIISILFFLFIVVDNMWLRMVLRLVLIPIVAGVAYEFIRLAGRSDSKVVSVISKPGLWLQSLTTSEPDDDMIEVAIASVEAVFDWRPYVEQVRQDMEEAEAAEAAQEIAVTAEVTETAEVSETTEAADTITEVEEAEEKESAEEKADEDLEMVDLDETEEDDEILKALDYVFAAPDEESEQ